MIMRNLAGVNNCDEYIKEELEKAGIPIIGKISKGEVPYSIAGKLGDWSFGRAWYYWAASVPEHQGIGLPLSVAKELHLKEYPFEEQKPRYGGLIEKYGDVVRVSGHVGAPHPKEWAFPTREVLDKESEKLEIDWGLIPFGELRKMCDEGKIVGDRFVDSYHIDTQEGFNELSRLIQSL